MRQREIEWRKRQRAVADGLDRLAATAEHDDRTERRIIGDADNQLAPICAPHHRLDQHAINVGAGRQSRGAIKHAMRRGGGGDGRHDVQDHAADIGLVRDVARMNLDGAGAVFGDDLFRDGGGLARVRRELHRRDGNAVGGEQVRRLHGIEPLRATRQRAGDDRARAGDIGREGFGQAGRRRHQRVARLTPMHQMHEAAHGAGLVMGDARFLEYAIARGAGAEPDGENGLGRQHGRVMRARRSGDGRGDLGAIRHRGRTMHDHDGVVGRVR